MLREPRFNTAPHIATVDPSVNDDSSQGYVVGSSWLNTVTKELWICISAGVGAAVWQNVGKDVTQSQVLYVGKHGSDLNDGKTPDRAFLTIGAAITAAGTPANETAAISVVVVDDGEYTENITPVSYVNIHAPTATFKGKVTMSNSFWRINFRRMINNGDNAILYKTPAFDSSDQVIETDSLYCDAPNYPAVYLWNGTTVSIRARKIVAVNADAISVANFGTSPILILNVDEIDCGTKDAIECSQAIVRGYVGWIHGRCALKGQLVQYEMMIGKIDCTEAVLITGAASTSYPISLIVSSLSGTVTVPDGYPLKLIVAKRNNFIATTDPTVTDDANDGYDQGSEWLNTVIKELWICISAEVGAAVWRNITNLTHQFYSTRPYIVGKNGKGQFDTINAAIQQAKADGMTESSTRVVVVIPGTYTEDVVLEQGLFLTSTFANPLHETAAWNLVTINGCITHAPTSNSSNCKVVGFKINGKAGVPTVAISGDKGASITFDSCNILSASGQYCFSLGAGGNAISRNITVQNCLLSPVSFPVARIGDTVGAEMLTICQSSVNGDLTGVIDCIDMHDRFFLYIKNRVEGSQQYVLGRLHVEAGSNASSTIQLHGMGIWVTSGSCILLDGPINSAASWMYQCWYAGPPGSATGIVIGGAFAANLRETPFGLQGDIRRYDGQFYRPIRNNYVATTDPAVTDDSASGYAVGSYWINLATKTLFECISPTAGAAVWERIAPEPRLVKTTEDLVAIVAAAAAGSQFILESGDHNLTGTLLINKSNIKIRGPATARLISPAAAVPAITIDCSAGALSNLWLEGFAIVVSATGTHGIFITGASSITTHMICQIGIQRASGTGSYGIYVNNAQWTTGEITCCTITSGFAEAIRVEPATGATDCIISFCFISLSANTASGITFRSGVLSHVSVGHDIIDGTASTGYAVYFAPATSGTQIHLCEISTGGFASGIYYDTSADYVNICDNNLFGTLSTAGSGIVISSSVDRAVVGSNIIKTFQYGIRATGGIANTVINGNVIYDVQYGIWLSGSGGLGNVGAISGNSIEAASSSSKTGIYVNELFKVSITGNSVKGFNDDVGADSAGIRCKSDDQVVSSNAVGDCYRGIEINSNGSGNISTCIGNNIYSCVYGIEVQNAVGKAFTITGNTIRDCTLQWIRIRIDGGESIKIDRNNCRTKSTVDANEGVLITGAPSAGATEFVAFSFSGNILNEYRGTAQAVRIVKVSNAVIEGNVIYDGDGDGLKLETVKESVINSNRIGGHLQAGKVGLIEDANCDQNLFSSNHLRGNTAATSFSGTNRTEFGNKV